MRPVVNMFKKECGGPLTFSMLPCKERGRVRNVIEKHGGQLISVCKKVDVRLTNKIETSDEDHIHIDFVLQSDANGNLLDIENFRIRNMRRSANKEQRAVLKDNKQGRHKYSKDDEEKILDYLQQCARSGHTCYTGGNALWKKMEQEKVTDHSWQSMRHHYLHKLKPVYEQPKNFITQRMHMGQVVLFADPGHNSPGKSKEGSKDDVHQESAPLCLSQVALPSKTTPLLSITAARDHDPHLPGRKREKEDQPSRLRALLPRRAKGDSSSDIGPGTAQAPELSKKPKQGASSRLGALKRTWRRRRRLFSDVEGLLTSPGKEPVFSPEKVINKVMADVVPDELQGSASLARSPNPLDNISKDDPSMTGTQSQGEPHCYARPRTRLCLHDAEKTLTASTEASGTQKSDEEVATAECKTGFGRWKLRSRAKLNQRTKRTLKSKKTLKQNPGICRGTKTVCCSRRNRTALSTKHMSGGTNTTGKDRSARLIKKGLPFKQQRCLARTTVSKADAPTRGTSRSKRRSPERTLDCTSATTTSAVERKNHGKPHNSSPNADESTAVATPGTIDGQHGGALSDALETLRTDSRVTIPDAPVRLGICQREEAGVPRQGLFRMETVPTVGDLRRMHETEQERTRLQEERIWKRDPLPGSWTRLKALKENASLPLEDLIAIELVMENGLWDRCRNDISAPTKTNHTVHSMDGELTLRACAANGVTNQGQKAKEPSVSPERKGVDKPRRRKTPAESKRRHRSPKRGKTDVDEETLARTRLDVDEQRVVRTRPDENEEPLTRTSFKMEEQRVVRTKLNVDEEPVARTKSDLEEQRMARARSNLDEEPVAKTKSDVDEQSLTRTRSAQTLASDTASETLSIRDTSPEECPGQTSSGDKVTNAANAGESAVILHVEHNESAIRETEEARQKREREELILRDSKALIISIFGIEAFENTLLFVSEEDFEAELHNQAVSTASKSNLLDATVPPEICSVASIDLHHIASAANSSSGNTSLSVSNLKVDFTSHSAMHQVEAGLIEHPSSVTMAEIPTTVITGHHTTLATVENTTAVFACQSARMSSTVLDFPKTAIYPARNDPDNKRGAFALAANANQSTNSPSSDQSDAYYSAEDYCGFFGRILDDSASNDGAVSEESS